MTFLGAEGGGGGWKRAATKWDRLREAQSCTTNIRDTACLRGVVPGKRGSARPEGRGAEQGKRGELEV